MAKGSGWKSRLERPPGCRIKRELQFRTRRPGRHQQPPSFGQWSSAFEGCQVTESSTEEPECEASSSNSPGAARRGAPPRSFRPLARTLLVSTRSPPLLVLCRRRRKRGVIDHSSEHRDTAGRPRVPDTCVSGVSLLCVRVSLPEQRMCYSIIKSSALLRRFSKRLWCAMRYIHFMSA